MVKKPPQKEYTLITVDENHALQIKNENLIQRVRNTAIFIEDAAAAVKERDKANRTLNEWLSYLACDPLPKPFKPEDIRKFFYKTSLFEDEDVEKTVNWQLAIDERSILNQDIDRVDLTRRFLGESKPNFGEQYDIRVNDAITIAKRIENYLENPSEKLSKRVQKDMEEMRFFAYQNINLYIDNLTYRILCSEDAYMDPIDVTTAEYSYHGKNFDMHLWTFRNVPIYLDSNDTPSKSIKLAEINTEVVMPYSVMCENMVIRGLHCNFDHFSVHARYFDLPYMDQVEENLRICLKDEWDAQMKIQAEVKIKMLNTRAEFEEAQRIKAEEEEAKAKKAKQEDKKQAPPPPKKEKPKKPPKEPPILTANIVPVVRQDFLNYDFTEYEESMMLLHPDSFGLTKGEINLRKYQILGGVYQINSLSKPNTVSLPKLIISWFTAEQCIEYKDVQAKFEGSTKSKAEAVRFFQITFKLPECYCYWGEPLPCLFEEGESYRTVNLPDDLASEKALTDIKPVIINDFNLHELFTKPLMYQFIENSIPRLISSFKFPEDLFNEEDDKKAKATLGRAKLSADEQAKEKELAMQRQMLSFDNQICPERLFPLFKKALPVVILPMPDEENPFQQLHPYEHYSDFFQALLSIEESYRTSTFKDKSGNAIKILAEKYDRNIRRPKPIASKTVLYEGLTERTSRAQSIGSKGMMERLSRTSERLSNVDYQKRPSELSGTSASAQSEQKKEAPTKTKAHKGGKGKGRTAKEVIKTESVSIVEDLETPYSKWSTSNILKSKFNAAARKVTIWTDRLGTFGFAYNRYQHFPFKSWALHPNEENPDEVELKIESEFAVFRFYVSQNGYRVSVSDFTKYYKSRKIYFENTEPISDIKILKEKLQQKYLNIFPERDSVWYITGYFSEKHLSAELHTYSCISLFATSLKFRHSIWNKLSNRRTMVLRFGELRDPEDDLFLLCIRPEDVTFVDITELCTELEVVDLEYIPTWRNLEWYPDLNHLITSTYVNWSEMRTKDPNVVYYLKNLLQAIRPLSCS